MVNVYFVIDNPEKMKLNGKISARYLPILHFRKRKEGNVLFNGALNTFLIRLYGIRLNFSVGIRVKFKVRVRVRVKDMVRAGKVFWVMAFYLSIQ